MGGEIVTESWFSSLWKTSRKNAPEPEKAVVGILAFEVVSLMSKVVSLWQCLRDKQVVRLREEIINSVGIQKLVSDDDDLLMNLAFAEMIENLGFVARSVARLGMRCADSVYHRLEHLFDAPIENNAEWYGWEYRGKKMERKVKKMERFIAVTAQLYQELDVLSELEQTLRRMQGNSDLDRVKLFEFQQKVMWQRQEVRNLREMSPWNRTFDYTVRLLARSVLTTLKRIKHVFGINQIASVEWNNDSEQMNAYCLPRSHSISAPLQSLVYPSENNPSRFYSGPLVGSVSKSGHYADKDRKKSKQRQANHRSTGPWGKHQYLKTKELTIVGPFKGCMMSGTNSPIVQSCTMRSSGVYLKNDEKTKGPNIGSISCSNWFESRLSLFNSRCRLLNAPQSTLGDAALALHYANIIILIEKLASSPHFFGLDTRDDLYDMLPKTIRTALKARLKSFAKTLGSSVYEAALATEWGLVLPRILEWLAPPAHNMIRWQSERNFEKQHLSSRTNVLLVQTIYFANQAKTEAAITELLVGLNYIWRFGKELNEKALLESAGSRAYG